MHVVGTSIDVPSLGWLLVLQRGGTRDPMTRMAWTADPSDIRVMD